MFCAGDDLLKTDKTFHITPLQIYALCTRLKSPEPTCGKQNLTYSVVLVSAGDLMANHYFDNLLNPSMVHTGCYIETGFLLRPVIFFLLKDESQAL